MSRITVIKSNGVRVPYDQEKIRRTLVRAGADERIIGRILDGLTPHLKDGMTTKRLFATLKRELRKENRGLARRYDLRDALLRFGPAGYTFERYVSAILTAHGYVSEVPEQELPGTCVSHEVDVVAEKDGRRAMIEAKFRNKFGELVTLKDTLATWARFLDLSAGGGSASGGNGGGKGGKAGGFDECWIVTNGKFSKPALQFGQCKGMKMIGWDSEERSLARMVDHAVLYPVTVIENLRQLELEQLAAKGLVLCRDLAARKPASLARAAGLNQERAEKIVRACQEVVES